MTTISATTPVALDVDDGIARLRLTGRRYPTG